MKTKTAVGILFLLVLFAGTRSLWAYDYQMNRLIDGVNRIGDKIQDRNNIEQDKTRIMRERNRIEQQRVKNEMDEAHRRNFFRQIETFFPDWRELYHHRFWNVVLENNSGLFNPFYLHEKKNAFGRVLGRTVVRISPKYAIELLRDIYKMEEKRLEMVNGNHDPKIMLEMAHFFGGYDIKWKKNEDVRTFCCFIYMAEYAGAKISKEDMRWINHRTTFKIRSEELRTAIKNCKKLGIERGGKKIKKTAAVESKPQKTKTNVRKKSSSSHASYNTAPSVQKTDVEKSPFANEEDEEWE